MFILGSGFCTADTVYFNDVSRGPGDTLQIGGVMISAFENLPSGFAVGQVATLAGAGLGNTALGPADEVNNVTHYSPASTTYRMPDSVQWEGVSFTVDGFINSVTIQPVFRACTDAGVPLPEISNFYILFFGWQRMGAQSQYVNALSGNLMTYTRNDDGYLPGSSFSIAVFLDRPDFGSSALPFGTEHLDEGVKAEFGFRVVSLDYTPVPEPCSGAILAIGAIAVLLGRQRGTAHHPGRWGSVTASAGDGD